MLKYLCQILMSILTIALLFKKVDWCEVEVKPIVKQGFGQNSSNENSNFKKVLSN